MGVCSEQRAGGARAALHWRDRQAFVASDCEYGSLEIHIRGTETGDAR